MAEQHIRLLQGLGLPQASIDALEGVTPEQLADWKPDEIQKAVLDAAKPRFLNDSEFLNSIPEDKIPEATRKKFEAGQYTRFQKEILETAVKQLGLTEEDLKDLSEEDRKSIKKTVAKVAETHLAKKGNVQGLQDMQKQLSELQTNLEGKDTEWEAKLSTKVGEVEGKAMARIMKHLTKAELLALTDVELVAPPAYILGPILDKMHGKYTLVLAEDDSISIKQKANPNLDVLVNNKPLSFTEALKAQVIEDKIGKVKGAPAPPKDAKTVTIEGGEGGYEVAGHLKDKIAKKIEQEGK